MAISATRGCERGPICTCATTHTITKPDYLLTNDGLPLSELLTRSLFVLLRQNNLYGVNVLVCVCSLFRSVNWSGRDANRTPFWSLWIVTMELTVPCLRYIHAATLRNLYFLLADVTVTNHGVLLIVLLCPPVGRYFWYESQASAGSFHFGHCCKAGGGGVEGGYVFIQLLPGKSVWYKVLPLVIDCKLVRTDSKPEQCGTSYGECEWAPH